ncbi:polyketide-8 synthase acyl carrier protein [Lentzea guizhouensis]|uniref:Polyketide-8 synthase acyl carrier protein n=1 Tax=Lentzea guizhouensis TaxID=1586287 RepID=A0A1B2HPV7_9PSEU|nr:phosphopantetheine-binding protein [Lentzea guizhouensis]ANZ39748.1 polyketide-8 synthase acyl carrier protein [Lentzea guizhouensis]
MTSAVLGKDELRVIVADVLDVDADLVTDDAHFGDDLGADSLLALEVMVILEKRYEVKLAESELMELTSLQKVYDLLQQKISEAAA